MKDTKGKKKKKNRNNEFTGTPETMFLNHLFFFFFFLSFFPVHPHLPLPLELYRLKPCRLANPQAENRRSMSRKKEFILNKAKITE